MPTRTSAKLQLPLRLRGGATGSLTQWWYKTLAKFGIFLKKGRLLVLGLDNAGKSTLLNALLDETTVLPTNGMRACTAALIELRHEDTPAHEPLYRGEVDFLSQAEWDRELDDMIDDLVSARNCHPRERHPNHARGRHI